jgi:mono/diheme cytochrome c family protein
MPTERPRSQTTAASRWLKRIVVGLGVVTALMAAAASYLAFAHPQMRPIDHTKKVVATPALIERGRYIVEAEAHCMFCHSEHDWTTHGGPSLPGLHGAGWDVPYADNKMPGRVFAPNITSDVETGIGAYPDDAIARAVREGVGRDGQALFMMPWTAYRHFSDTDMNAIIAYLRTVPAVEKSRQRTTIDLPVRWFLKRLPRPLAGPVPEPDLSEPIKRGKHLATVGLCHHCHTPVDGRHRPLPGMDFAGGRTFVIGGALTRASNITPHASGIAHYSEELFIRVLRTGNVGGRRLSPVMPWYDLRQMTDRDLKALWAYLKTVPAVAHDVRREEVAVKDNPAIDEHPPSARLAN